jgi:SAM-dependent methyltransferase
VASLSLSALAARTRVLRSSDEQHPLFARAWSRLSGRVVSHHQRAELIEGLHGRVLEIGAGDGSNFSHYPSDVTEVLAIEPEPYLRDLAALAALAAPVRITVLDGTAELLPVEDGSCHAAVSSLVLCSVGDQRAALAELHRALRPGGELRFFEHVVADQGLGRAVQSGLDGSGIWPQLGAGCHLSRDTVAAITDAGFAVEEIRRFNSGPGSLGIPFVLGSARRG